MAYFEAGESLTDEQRHKTEQRILHDALLIHDGAHITKLGTLAVTQYQIAKAQLVGDPLYSFRIGAGFEESPLSMRVESNSEKDRWLDEPLRERMKRDYPGSHIPNSIQTARGALCIGRARTRAITGIGNKTMSKLESLMANEYFEWKDEPTIEDIAQYCDYLSQVPALATLPKDLLRQGATVENMSVVDALNPEKNRERLAKWNRAL